MWRSWNTAASSLVTDKVVIVVRTVVCVRESYDRDIRAL